MTQIGVKAGLLLRAVFCLFAPIQVEASPKSESIGKVGKESQKILSESSRISLLCSADFRQLSIERWFQPAGVPIESIRPIAKQHLQQELLQFAQKMFSEKNPGGSFQPEASFVLNNDKLKLQYIAYLLDQEKYDGVVEAFEMPEGVDLSETERIQPLLRQIQLVRHLKTLCAKRWGVTSSLWTESMLQSVSGAAFLVAFVTNLSIYSQLANPIFLASAAAGMSAYLLSSLRKSKELQDETQLFALSDQEKRIQVLGILGDLLIGSTYGLIAANGARFTSPVFETTSTLLPVSKAHRFWQPGIQRQLARSVKNIRGIKLLVPVFDSNYAKIIFAGTFLIRT